MHIARLDVSTVQVMFDHWLYFCDEVFTGRAAAGTMQPKQTCSLDPASDLIRQICTQRMNPWQTGLFTRPSSELTV